MREVALQKYLEIPIFPIPLDFSLWYLMCFGPFDILGVGENVISFWVAPKQTWLRVLRISSRRQNSVLRTKRNFQKFQMVRSICNK